MLVNIAFYGLIFVLSLYFQQQNGLSPLQTGLAFLPMMGVVRPFNILGPRLSERFGAAKRALNREHHQSGGKQGHGQK